MCPIAVILILTASLRLAWKFERGPEDDVRSATEWRGPSEDHERTGRSAVQQD